MATSNLPLESVLLLLAIGAFIGACAASVFFLLRRRNDAQADAAVADALTPVAESLQALAAQVERHERTNVAAQTELRTTLTTTWESQVQLLQRSTEDVRREASRLAEVLSRSEPAGAGAKCNCVDWSRPHGYLIALILLSKLHLIQSTPLVART